MFPPKALEIVYGVIPMVILFSIIAILLRIVIASYNHEKINIFNDFKLVMYIIYLFVLFQLVTTTDYSSYSNNFVPFKEILRYNFKSALFIRNVVGNILLFIPFGYLISDVIYMTTKHKNVFVSLVFTLLTSAGIETIQMYIGRSFDIDDIILNFIGGLFGYIAFLIVRAVLKEDSILTKIIKVLIFMIFVILISLWIYKIILKGEL